MRLDVSPGALRGCTSWSSPEGPMQVMIRLSGLPLIIAIREKKIFVQNNIEKIFIRQDEADSPGNAVTAWKGLAGGYVPGEKGKRAEAVAQEALDALNTEKGDVDRHLADQLLIYAALADGRTSYSTGAVTEHLRTNAYVISRFMERKIRLDNGRIEVD